MARRIAHRLWIGFSAATIASVASVAVAGKPTGPAAPRMGSRDEARIELGRRLFFDPVASRVGMRSCADCHDPRHGFSDPATFSRDDRVSTRRHSQTLIDGADNPSAHWDGAFRRVEDLVTARVTLAARGSTSSGHEIPLMGGRSTDGSAEANASSSGSSVGRSTTPTPAMSEEPAMDGGGMEGYSGPAAPDHGGGSPDPGMGDSNGGYDSGGGDGNAFKKPAGEGASPDAGASAAPAAPTTPGDPPSSAPSSPAGGSVGSPSAGQAPGADAGRADGGAGANAPKAAKEGSTGPDPYDPNGLDAGGSDLKPAFIAESVEVSKLPGADDTIEASGRYREAFEAVYGSPSVTIARVAEAIGAYCHSIRSGAAPYDRFAGGDEAALSDAEKRGLELFKGRAKCATCHTMTGERAAFTDYVPHVTGISWKGLDAKDDAERARLAPTDADEGAGAVSGRPKDRRAFKTPTLRDVAGRGPYMHDGSLASLEAVVRYYARPAADPSLDPRLAGFEASARDVTDLVAFLRSLSSDVRPGLATTAWGRRAKSTRIELVDAKGRPLARQPFLLVPAGDVLPGGRLDDAPRSLVTDDRGVAEFTPPAWSHARIALPDGLRPRLGTLIPDTCREARIEVPVLGRTRLLVTFPATMEPPLALVGDHESATFFHDRRLPRTVFRREALMPTGGGRSVAAYSAVYRTDAPSNVALRLPAKVWGLDRLRMTLEPEATKTLDLSK